MTALALEGIHAGYGAVPVLHDVSLTVPIGSTVALLGSNGAGKTTLLRVASGLIAPTSGTVRLKGENVAGWSPQRIARQGLCLVPEGRGVFPNLTVRENILLHSHRGQETESVERTIALFPALGNRLSQRAGTLSGGEQQMLALSRVYTSDASVVLLDEVSLGLAPAMVDKIFDVFVPLTSSGMSVLLVEQYVTRALEIADYVYLLSRGTVVFVGEPGELDDQSVLRSYLGLSG